MCPETLQQYGRFTTLFNGFEDNAKIIAGTAGPRPGQGSCEFVGPERRMKRILRQLRNGFKQIGGMLGMTTYMLAG